MAELDQLPEWLRLEEQSNPNLPTPNLLEEFNFVLGESSKTLFVLDSTNKTDADNRLYLEFFVYPLSDANHYTVPNRPA